MRASIIAPLLFAVGQQALAGGPALIWDRSNTLACAVVAAETCRYPGGVKTCAPAEAPFEAVKIDYGKGQVNLLAKGGGVEAWTILGINYSAGPGAQLQLLHIRHATRSTDVVLDQSGVLRFTFKRPGGDLVVTARCRAR